MREIKFRAWDNEKEEWVYNPESGYIAIKQDDKIEFDYDEDSIVLQQYTGLKDKNGKEIYEGDIIEWNGYRSFVIWSFDRYRFNGYINGNPDLMQAVCHDIGYGDGVVIGNIYENPELLETT